MKKVIMIDSSVAARYAIDLCKSLHHDDVDVRFIVTEDRNVDEDLPFAVLRWAPPKKPSVSKLKKTVAYMAYLIKVAAYIMKSDADVVHYQWFRREKIESFFYLFLRLMGTRLVFTAHDVLPLAKGSFDYFTNHIIYRSSSALIVHSEFLKKDLHQKFKIDEEKIFVVPHGHCDQYLPSEDVSKSEARKKFRLKEKDHVLLFFGYIKKYKGLDILLKAFEIAAEQDEDLRLIIAGVPANDYLDREYRQLIAANRFKERIIAHLEFIKDSDLPHYLIASDVVVLPYRNIYHSGITHLAFSFSRPVLATSVGDFPEIIEDEKSGFLLEHMEEETLSQMILKVFSPPVQLSRMGEYANRMNRERFSWESSAQKTKKVYETITN